MSLDISRVHKVLLDGKTYRGEGQTTAKAAVVIGHIGNGENLVYVLLDNITLRHDFNTALRFVVGELEPDWQVVDDGVSPTQIKVGPGVVVYTDRPNRVENVPYIVVKDLNNDE